MSIRVEVLPFILASLAAGGVLALLCRAFRVSWSSSAIAGVVLALVACGYMCWFFRDPERVSPADRDLVVAAADGVVAQIRNMREDKYLKADCVRVSIFLSLFDVHVNRAPIAGTSTFLGYFPGKRLFTFDDKSSEVNQHNSILIEGESTRCLVKQIVGPVARRVVYWPDPDRPVPLEKGERIGMMKFGSRLDMYFPADEVTVTAKVGERVAAGVSVIARVNPRQEAP
jgi:phosphatidylserine decarboxylase